MNCKPREICPFVGAPCAYEVDIDGFLYICRFFDEYAPSDTEPCLIKRAANRILKIPDKPEEAPLDLPY